MTKFKIGDEEYTEEVNTSYDQDQEIGDDPQALNTELSNSEPIDAPTGGDFYTIQTGGPKEGLGEYQSVWKQLGYETKASDDLDNYLNDREFTFNREIEAQDWWNSLRKESRSGIIPNTNDWDLLDDESRTKLRKYLGHESYGMPANLMTNEELVDAQLKLKGGFSNISYLNQIESEMRERSLEKFESRDQQQWYHATDQTYLDDEPHENRKVKGESNEKAYSDLNPYDILCTNCNGEGAFNSMDDWYKCVDCDGKGKILIIKEECSNCWGKGSYITDEYWGSDGKQYPEYSECYQCDGKGYTEQHDWMDRDNFDLTYRVKDLQSKGLIGEKLNKDGTGTAVARRGINPNNKKHVVMKFDYVSQSDCKICRPYDGKAFGRDSPNRPVIPRLERQGKKGSRPYTHPNCKCRWIKVFNEVNTKDSMIGEAVDKKLIARARKEYGNDKEFDRLNNVKRNIVIINMLKKDLGMESESEEFIELVDPLPLASMAQIAFNAIKEPVKTRLRRGEAKVKATEQEGPYGIQPMLDQIVNKALGKEEKEEIEEEVNKDFTLDNLLQLVADKLTKKAAKKMGLESRANENTIIIEDCPKCDGNGRWITDNWGSDEHPLFDYDTCEQCSGTGKIPISVIGQTEDNVIDNMPENLFGESHKVKANEYISEYEELCDFCHEEASSMRKTQTGEDICYVCDRINVKGEFDESLAKANENDVFKYFDKVDDYLGEGYHALKCKTCGEHMDFEMPEHMLMEHIMFDHGVSESHKVKGNEYYGGLDSPIDEHFSFEDDHALARGWECKHCGYSFEENEYSLLEPHLKEQHDIVIPDEVWESSESLAREWDPHSDEEDYKVISPDVLTDDKEEAEEYKMDTLCDTCGKTYEDHDRFSTQHEFKFPEGWADESSKGGSGFYSKHAGGTPERLDDINEWDKKKDNAYDYLHKTIDHIGDGGQPWQRGEEGMTEDDWEHETIKDWNGADNEWRDMIMLNAGISYSTRNTYTQLDGHLRWSTLTYGDQVKVINYFKEHNKIANEWFDPAMGIEHDRDPSDCTFHQYSDEYIIRNEDGEGHCSRCGASVGWKESPPPNYEHKTQTGFASGGKPTRISRLGEGGKGSGRKDHRPWMLGTELSDVCQVCMISTEWEGSICNMCGTDSKTL